MITEIARLATTLLNPYRPILVGNSLPLLRACQPRSRCLHHPELLDFVALLQDLDWTADCFVLDAREETPQASLALLRVALDRMEKQGEGVLLLPTATIAAAFVGQEEWQHVWAQLIAGDLSLIWFAKDHDQGMRRWPAPRSTSLAACLAAAQQYATQRLRLRPGAEAAEYLHAEQTVKLWEVAQREWQLPQPSPHLSLDAAGRLQFQLSEFDLHCQPLDATTLSRLRQLDGHHPAPLLVARETRTLLEQAAGLKPAPFQSWLRVAPAVRPAVVAALASFQTERAPLYPLNAAQRLAFLDELDSITCCDHLYAPPTAPYHSAAPLFRAGQSYPITARSVTVARTGSRLNMVGVRETVTWDGTQTAYFLTVNDREYCFGEASWRDANVRLTLAGLPAPVTVDFTLSQLSLHFTVPEVPDVATVFPEQYRQNLQTLDDLVALLNATAEKLFSLIPFQREDLARLALHPGAILGWDTGLGKTIAMFLWPLLKVGSLVPASPAGNRLVPRLPVLLVVPGDGHDQTDDESREHFKTVATRLDSQATFLRLATLNPQLGTRTLPPGYYLTSYTQLSQNGVTPPPPETPKEFRAGIGESRTYQLSTLDARPATLTVKCVYDAALVDLCQDCFGAVVVDEATKLQGDDTLIGVGCRQIKSPHRLPMTATPIKNRMPQLFHLAHFACGGADQPTARFPYGPRDREAFTREFEVGETGPTGRRKRTAQVSNIHRAWKIFPALILRRRKADCGQDIVPMHRHIIRTPMGIHQAAAYKYHLLARYEDERGRPALGARLQALRLAAATPTSRLLQPKLFPATLSPIPASYRSPHDYIPKLATTLTLIEQVLRRGEQVLVGAAFEDGLEALSTRLVAAGIPHLVLDGRSAPGRRGELARQFKRGSPRSQREGLSATHSPFPVTLAGIESMAELHSFRFCNNVILTSYSWALDKMEQFINRVHRINSPWPVNLWSVLCDGSADRVLEASNYEKRDAAELVLDARLLGTAVNEVNLAEVLEVAAQDFAANQNYLDERDLEQDWPKLRAALAAAYHQWPVRRSRPVDLQLPTELVRLPPPPPTPLIGLPGQASPETLEATLPLWQQFLQPRPPGD